MRIHVLIETITGSSSVELEIETDESPEIFVRNLNEHKGIFYSRNESETTDGFKRFLPLHKIVSLIFFESTTANDKTYHAMR